MQVKNEQFFSLESKIKRLPKNFLGFQLFQKKSYGLPTLKFFELTINLEENNYSY